MSHHVKNSLIGAISFDREGVARLLLKEAVQCGCGRMAMFVVNRDGRTRCVGCDEQYQRSSSTLAKDVTLLPESAGQA